MQRFSPDSKSKSRRLREAALDKKFQRFHNFVHIPITNRFCFIISKNNDTFVIIEPAIRYKIYNNSPHYMNP